LTDTASPLQPIPVRSVARNSVLLFGLQVFARFLNFIATILLANYLGTELFGAYNYALALTTLFVPLADLGMDTFFLREIPRRVREETSQLLGSVLLSKAGITFLVLIFITIVASSLEPVGSERFGYILLAGGVVLLRAYWNTFSSLLRGLDRVQDETWMFALTRILEFAGILAALLSNADLSTVLALMLMMNGVAVVLTIAVVRGRFIPIAIDRRRTTLVAVIRGGLPFALASIFTNIYFHFDTVLLAKMISDHAAGTYRAAYNLVIPLLMVSGAISAAAFPFLSQNFRSQPEVVSRVIRTSIRLLTMVSLPTAIITTFVAPDIIAFLFAPEFAEAATTLAIVIWFLPIGFLTNFFGHALGAMDDQPFVLRVNTVNLSFNVVANIIFIPLYAQTAAAVITVATELIGLSLLYPRIRKSMSASPEPSRFLKMGLAGMLLIPYLLYRPEIHVLLNITIGLVLYGVLLLALRAVTPKEFLNLALLRMIRQPHESA
jgi:O-antigen/teichoic acid export membrane protein